MFGLPNEINQSLQDETKTIKGLLQKKMQDEINKKKKIQMKNKRSSTSDNQLEINGQNNKKQDQSQIKQIIIFKNTNLMSGNEEHNQNKHELSEEGILEELQQINQSLDTKKDEIMEPTLHN